MTDTALDPRSAKPAALELRDYIRILRTYWLGGVMIVLIALLAGAGWTLTQPRIYSATASGLVQAPTGDDASLAYAADSLSKSQAQSYVQLARSLAVANTVATNTNAVGTASALLGNISANLPSGTAIIEITATGSTPTEAANLANAWVAGLTAQVETVQQSGGGITSQLTKFSLLAEAALPTAPVSPNVKVTLLLAGLAGLVFSFVFALIRDHLDRRIRSAEQIESSFKSPVLGTLPISPLLIDGRQLISRQGSSQPADRQANFAMSESLRELRTNISYVNVDEPPRIIVVTSPRPGDGKSTIAANLAEALASSSAERVIAIDCDLRRPSLSGIFQVAQGAGLTDVLTGRATLDEVLQQTGENSNLWVLGAGRIPPNPSELLGSRSLKELLALLSKQAILILDAPPVLPVTDAVVLANSADGVLVVVSARRTTFDQLDRTLQLVRRGGGKLFGTVLNRVPRRGQDARAYGYYGDGYYTQDQLLEDAAVGDSLNETADEFVSSEASVTSMGAPVAAEDHLNRESSPRRAARAAERAHH